MQKYAAQANDDSGTMTIYWITYSDPEHIALGVGWEVFEAADSAAALALMYARWPTAARDECLD
jgi:hypothetical protein